MSEWKYLKLGLTSTQFIDGDRSKKYPARNDFLESGVLFLNGESINTGVIRQEFANYISEEKYAEITKGRIKKGDILLTTRGNSLGDCAIVKIPDRGLINAQMLILRPKSNEIAFSFLFYYLRSNSAKDMMINISSGSAQPQIPIQDLKFLSLPIPPLPIQQKIAAVLSAYDDLIENNDRRIALLEKMAEEIYREWFVRLRFPGHEQVTFHKGIPEGWKIQPLQEITRINEKSVMKGKEPKTITYIDIGSVTTNRINNIEKINFNDAPGRARRIVRHGDTIWSTVRPANRAYCLILDPIQNLIASTGFAVMSPKKYIPYSFLYWVTTSNTFVEHISNVAKGSAYPAAGKEDFEKSEILIPSEELLWRFHALCEPMLKQKHTLAERNKNLKQTRDRLLTRLISGKLSVEDLDIQFPPSMIAETNPTK